MARYSLCLGSFTNLTEAAEKKLEEHWDLDGQLGENQERS